MLGQHHVLIGCAGVVAAAAVAQQNGLPLPVEAVWVSPWGFDLPQAPLLLAAAALGSLLPDVDRPGTLLTNFSPILRLALAIPSALLPHRGPTHSLLAWGVLAALAVSGAEQVGLTGCALAASLGYLLHLAADALTTSGAPLLWPLYGGNLGFPPFRRLRFRTGGLMEYLVTGAVLLWTLVLLLDTGWPLP